MCIRDRINILLFGPAGYGGVFYLPQTIIFLGFLIFYGF